MHRLGKVGLNWFFTCGEDKSIKILLEVQKNCCLLGKVPILGKFLAHETQFLLKMPNIEISSNIYPRNQSTAAIEKRRLDRMLGMSTY